jgi:tetratricopeptide (TPR) repeat protein
MSNMSQELDEGQRRLSAQMAQHQAELAAYRSLGDALGEGHSLNSLGITCHQLGRWDQAITYFVEALATYRRVQDRQGVGETLNNLGNVYRFHGEWALATNYFEESLAICRELSRNE